jgi:hypothetical protein
VADGDHDLAQTHDGVATVMGVAGASGGDKWLEMWRHAVAAPADVR